MPVLTGNIYTKGTFGNLCFYRVQGKYYVRRKSRLTGKRVKKDPVFRRTMEHAGILARASKIGSVIYRALPADFRQFWMYRAFTGEAIGLLRGGMTEPEVKELLWKRYAEATIRKSNRHKLKKKKKAVVHAAPKKIVTALYIPVKFPVRQETNTGTNRVRAGQRRIRAG